MKLLLNMLWIVGLLPICLADAGEAERLKRMRSLVDPLVSRSDALVEPTANNWGIARGNVQLSINLKNGHSRILTNEPVELIVCFKNVSTNETFTVYLSHNEDALHGFGFQIISPSGKEARLIPALSRGSGRFMNIGPSQIGHFEFNLSRLFHFNEIGIYTIVARRTIHSRATERPITVISNPLLVSVVNAP